MQEEGPAEGVVGVEVAEEDDIDRVQLDARAAQVWQYGGRRFHQQVVVNDKAVPVAAGRIEIPCSQKGEVNDTQSVSVTRLRGPAGDSETHYHDLLAGHRGPRLPRLSAGR